MNLIALPLGEKMTRFRAGGHRAAVLLLALAAVLAACGESAPSRFYLLSATPPSANAPAPRAVALGVGPIQMPRHLDRAQIVSFTSANQLQLAKVTATNARTAHNPASFPAFAANATSTIRAVLTRSTGVLQVYKGGVLQHTSAAGDFSGLTGSIIGFQFQQAYTSTPFEVDNVIAV